MRTLIRLLLPACVADRICPKCGQYYDISDPADSQPHNNGWCV